ncbi:MAG: prepilin peptidase [Clostridia bacterium]|nr:prepilin peptidase [Clostridia bacterium]
MIPAILVSCLCGLVIGCFLNTMVYRLSSEEKTLVTEDCICPVCGHRLALWEQIPIVGYLVLGGHCRYCKAAISAHYPLVEGGCAALYALLARLTLPRLPLFLLLALLFDAALAVLLLRRVPQTRQTAVQYPHPRKIIAAAVILLFYHLLIAAAVGIVLLA